MIIAMLGMLISGALVLIGYGIYSEFQARRVNDLQANLFPNRDLPAKPTFLQARLHQFQLAIATHPFKAYGVIESLFWLACLIPLINHMLAPRGGWAAYFTWMMVIIPHEVGHFICSPFGTMMMFLGGSIWQVLIWLLLGTYTLLIHRQITNALIFGMIIGHSFMDMSVYIRDARSRDLPLLFGMDNSHHDWWNILRRLGLLKYDHILADTAFMLGVLIVLSAILLGIWTAWVFPRLALGRRPRYQGHLLKATYSPDGMPKT